ncbi:hydroxyethylthiazole kinase [Epilithonimonas hungarica]|uniref:hydroxyethylthiazole kinase n=1 Tax=Epilithonimonas hungarica TaxID=454006 RepID=UPI00278B009C|nr:hydroxyethylthiazole kinase [Epilithonimonas hungarica]MDP9955228.1 hydroxyethylthiazole kinase [Epilithonimonas hungarica]
MENNLWNYIQSVKDQSPLVHNITNFVVMNNTANALLAVGASPIMAHAKSEIREMIAISNVVVINIGTLDEYWSEAMLIAAEEAHRLNKTWILDPVGAGATSFRDEVLAKLLQFKPTVIRGNASEIIALAKANKTVTKGVDSTAESNEAINAAKYLVENYQSVVCISGATDIIIDDKETYFVENGHPLMTKVTGLGCSASSIIGAFAGISENKIEATVAAMSLLGIAGELAEKISNGPGSLQMNILDKLYNISEQEFFENVKVSKK